VYETNDRYLKYREVAALLGVSVSWVYLHVRPDAQPRLPHRRIGRTLRFLRSDIEDFLKVASHPPRDLEGGQ